MFWEPRTYRTSVASAGLVTFEVVHAETDLQIAAMSDLTEHARELVRVVRAELDGYVGLHPHFAASFVPVEVEPDAPEIVRAMAEAASVARVGPMAAVAGAIAEHVARGLAAHSREVIVENGGDVFLLGRTERRVLLLAGDSPLSGRLAVTLGPEGLPVAVCTSSGTVGHSTSLGSAQAVTVIAESGALADAAATAGGNRIHGPGDLERALEEIRALAGVRGVVVLSGDRVGAAGDVRLERIGA